MFTTARIGQAGEGQVARWLEANGYTTNWNTRAPGSTDIEARGSKANLLVQVKAAVSPNAPASLSSDEERNIKSRAARLRFEAWEAQVNLDDKLGLVGKIVWRKLS